MRRFLSVLLFMRAAIASSCDAEPLVLPLRDVQILGDNKQSLMRGIPAEVGTPPQKIVLLPWADLNNTIIYNSEPHCMNDTMYSEKSCMVERGGLFNEKVSKSFTKTKNLIEAGGAPNETIFKGSVYGIKTLPEKSFGGIDKLKLEGAVEVPKFSFGIPTSNWDDSHTTLSALGLGRNSTYLNVLLKAEKITSRVWSIFWGQFGSEKPFDGSLMLGGYDEAKVTGKNYTAPLVYDHFDQAQGCYTGMRVTVRDIKINFVGGTNTSLFTAGTALHFCIDPAHHLLMQAPTDVFDKFKTIAGVEGGHSTSDLHWMAFQPSKRKQFHGDLTFHLDSGLEIRVPNNQFVFPEAEIDKAGSRVYNQTQQSILINDIEDEALILGRYFLTAAYLMVNQDAGTFTLWKANVTEESKPVRVFDEKTGEKCGDKASGVIQPSASSTAKPESESQEGRTSPSGGVIGGIVVGSILGVTVIAAGVYYALSQYRKRRMKKNTFYYYPAHEDMQRSNVHEMDSTNSPQAAKAERKIIVF
ncbi:unnamed protein product [Fusarium equiseti]|uniref:Peptidase A1 domain-containing protein n=1 Tax=Fusarium equiseti TaxID=61235 RepID=A0A8J2NDE0_FUSEQ|nr:unnamed protein product [Fusarium equiseti]